MNAPKFCLMSFLAVLILPSKAEVYYGYGSSVKVGTFPGTAVSWYAECGSESEPPSGATPLDVTPADNDGHTWVIIKPKKVTWTNPLPATTYVLGTDGVTYGRSGEPVPASLSMSKSTMSLSGRTIRVYGCRFAYNNGESTAATAGAILAATYEFNSVGNSFQFGCVSAGGPSTNVRRLQMTGTFVAGSDVTFDYFCSWDNTTITGNCFAFIDLAGDFSAFKGRHRVSETATVKAYPECTLYLRMHSESAFGDPTVVAKDALTVTNLTSLYISPNVVQSANRGITLALADTDRFYLEATASLTNPYKYGEDWTLSTPLYGAAGTLVKRGPGTIAVTAPWEVKNVEVREGVLDFQPGAAFADGTTIVVREGAEVVIGSGVAYGNVTFDTSAGGTVRLPPQPNVYYGYAGSKAQPFPGASVKWYAEYGSATAPLEGATPVDVTPTEGDGCTWVIVKPAKLKWVNPLPATKYVFGTDGKTCGLLGQPTSAVLNMNISTLNLASGSFTVYGCEFGQNLGESDATSGSILDGTYEFFNVGNRFAFGCQTAGGPSSNVRRLQLKGAFVGDADVVLEYFVSWDNTTVTGDTFAYLEIDGDFSAFKGRHFASQTAAARDYPESTLYLRMHSESAFGDPTVVAKDALTVTNLTSLYISPNVVQSANRGITLALADTDRFYLEASATKTPYRCAADWALSTPLYGTSGTLVKRGPGTITVTAPWEVKKVEVREGKLDFRSGAAFSDGTTIVVKKGAVVHVGKDVDYGNVTFDTSDGGQVKFSQGLILLFR